MRKDRTFIIGDVHGCYLELRALVDALDPKSGDKFIFVGDIVDKGPDTIKSLRYVKLLVSLYPGSVCVAGNHESKAIERLRQAKGAKAEPWHQEATEEDWAFIKSMPLYHRLPEFNALVVHAGVFPRFFDLYPEGIDDKRLLVDGWQRGGGKYRGRARRFQYVRYINTETGDMVGLGNESDATPHWTELYDGREGTIYFGHEPQRANDFSPKVAEHAIGLDTACVTGGRLTAAVLKENNPVEYVQVHPTRTYQEWKPEMYFYAKEKQDD